MKNRILSIALALCMVAVVFISVPSKGEVNYTGSVQTTDDTGELKDVFFEGDSVYVNVVLYLQGELTQDNIRVRLLDQDGYSVSTIDAITNVLDPGYYNSSEVDTHLTANVDVDGEMCVCEVQVSVNGIYGWEVYTSTQIIVKKSGVSIDPSSGHYYPGQDVTITVLTGESDAFRVVITNETHEIVHWYFQNAEDGVWSMPWTVPEDAKDGTYRLRVYWEETDDLWAQMSFQVNMYEFYLSSDRYMALPGETVTVDYYVRDVATQNFSTDVDIEWRANWFNDTGVEINTTGTLPDSHGSEAFTIPLNINLTSYYSMAFWANDSDDRSEAIYWTFIIGTLDANVDTDHSAYEAGEKVTVDVEAFVSADFSLEGALPDADVEIVVERDGVVLEEYGAAGLVTGIEGVVEHEFILSSSSELGTYLVIATVSKIGYTVEVMTSFDVEVSRSFMVSLDLDNYWSGQEATATFEAMWGTERVYGLTIFYEVTGDGQLLLANTTMSDSVTFQIDEGFIGQMWITAYTNLNGYDMDDSDSANVEKAYLALVPNAVTYTGGDTLTWSFEVATAMTDAQLSYEIVDSTGTTVESDVMELIMSGSFSCVAAADDTPTWYRGTLTLNDGLGNVFSVSSFVYLTASYTLTIWVESSSKTVSGAFEPGNVVTFGYEITTNGRALPRDVYEIWFGSDMDENQAWAFLTSSSTGTFTIEVPEHLPDGAYAVGAEVYDGLTGQFLSEAWTPMSVQADQGLWDKDVSGMSMTDFTIMMLLVIMIVLLIVVPFAKGRMGAQKPARPEPVTHHVPPPQEPEQPQ